MPDREKVIEHLRAIANICARNGAIQTMTVIDNAIALLKEQEARVMTAEEMAQIEPDTVYWGEGHHVRNLWPMAFTDEAIEDSDSGFMKDSYGRIYEVELYNKGVMGWRLWTSRPTEEQRKAVPWEPPKEDSDA